MITQQQVASVVGTEAYDTGGNKIGKVGQIYLDDDTGEPEFATLHTGLFGSKETFVPLAQASFDGGRLTVPFTKDAVKDAPRIDTDGHLSEQEEAQLYQYYGLDSSDRRSNTGLPSAPGSVQSAAAAATGRHAAETRREEDATAGGIGDQDALAGTGGEDAGLAPERDTTTGGRGRLRKYVVTREVRIEEIGDDDLGNRNLGNNNLGNDDLSNDDLSNDDLSNDTGGTTR